MSEPKHGLPDAVNNVFGDILPDVTTDERDVDTSGGADDHERWLRDNVPPHHE